MNETAQCASESEGNIKYVVLTHVYDFKITRENRFMLGMDKKKICRSSLFTSAAPSALSSRGRARLTKRSFGCIRCDEQSETSIDRKAGHAVHEINNNSFIFHQNIGGTEGKSHSRVA